MEFKIPTTYLEVTIDTQNHKRHSKFLQKEVTVNIKEMTGADFPVSHRVTRTNTRGTFEFVLRTTEGRLFTMYSDPYRFGPKVNHAKNGLCALDSISYRVPALRELIQTPIESEEKIDELIKTAEDSVRIYDGVFWCRTDEEPCYYVNHMGMANGFDLVLSIHGARADTLNGMDNAIFRGDEILSLERYLRELLDIYPVNMRDAVKDSIAHASEWLKYNEIKIVTPVHIAATHEDRDEESLRSRIGEYIDRLPKLPIPDEWEFTDFLRDNLITRICGDEEYRHGERLTNKKLDKALKDFLLELMSVWNSATHEPL